MNATNRPQPTARSGPVVAIAGVIAAVAVAAVALFAFGRESEEATLGGDEVASPTSTEISVTTSEPGATTDPDQSAEPADDGATPTSDQDSSSPDDSSPDGSTATTTPGQTGSSGSASSSTTGGRSTTTIGTTDETVEADETTDEPNDADPNPGGPDDGGTGGPAPTSPAPTSGTCSVASDRLDGRAGVVDLGTAGACGAVSATIEAVNPRDDLTGSDWARDIRVCQRHPAATAVRIVVTTANETVELTEGWSRSAAEAAADPVQSIAVIFDDQDTPITGPRPIATCRTDDAEVSLVHRPAR